MKHAHRLIVWLVLPLCIFLFSGCRQQPTQQKKDIQEKQIKQVNTNYMRIAFAHPVIKVNGKRANKKEGDYQEWIEVAYPQNSTNVIALTILDSEGVEHVLRGKIKVFEYSKNSKPEGESGELVYVAPENPEYTYLSIIRNGYGEFSIKEQVRDPAKGEIEGSVVVQLILGTKKKK